jgi:uncharacterized membrane protein YdcZ (DUF606 family)
VTLQIGSNALLKEAVDRSLPAVIVSSVLGVLLLAGTTLVARLPWPSLAAFTTAPASAWLGGIAGAIYAVVTIVLASMASPAASPAGSPPPPSGSPRACS